MLQLGLELITDEIDVLVPVWLNPLVEPSGLIFYVYRRVKILIFSIIKDPWKV
jgi:hypothetical protein